MVKGDKEDGSWAQNLNPPPASKIMPFLNVAILMVAEISLGVLQTKGSVQLYVPLNQWDLKCNFIHIIQKYCNPVVFSACYSQGSGHRIE